MTGKTGESAPTRTDFVMTFGPVPPAGPYGMAAFGLSRDGGQGLAALASGGVTEFVAARLTKDLALGQELMACRTLSDVQGAQMRYLQAWAHDYMVEFPRAMLGGYPTGMPEEQSGLASKHADDHMAV